MINEIVDKSRNRQLRRYYGQCPPVLFVYVVVLFSHKHRTIEKNIEATKNSNCFYSLSAVVRLMAEKKMKYRTSEVERNQKKRILSHVKFGIFHVPLSEEDQSVTLDNLEIWDLEAISCAKSTSILNRI